MFSWFCFLRDVPPLDAPTLDGLAARIATVPALAGGSVFNPTPDPTAHPFPDNEPAPPLGLQLHFRTIEALESAVAGAAGLLDPSICRDRTPTHQAMLRRRFPAPDAILQTPPGRLPCSYLVHYPGPAADLNAWNRHYNTHHPPLMARFSGVRAIEIYTRIDWVSALDWPKEDAMQRNKLLFDDAEALSAGLLSPALADMRADFHQFPPFSGGNVHYVLQTRRVGDDP